MSTVGLEDAQFDVGLQDVCRRGKIAARRSMVMVEDSPGWLREFLRFSSDRSLTILLYALLLLEFVVLPFWSDTRVGKFVVDGFLALILVSGALAVRGFDA